MGKGRYIEVAAWASRKTQAHTSGVEHGEKSGSDQSYPGYRLHALSGRLEGFWSVWVTGNYRVLFRFEKGDVFNVDYVDYH